MLRYALRRTLLIPPTFFFVSLVLFLVLNLAPGEPGAAGDGTESSGQGEERESYRLFKEQFNLDKPVVVNTRSWLSQAQVVRWIDAAYRLTGDPSTADVVGAQERLDEHGHYLVRHLVALLDDPVRVDAALDTLPRATGGEPARSAFEWREFFEANRSRFVFSPGRSLYNFALDTRFAAWWSNLLQLDFGLSIVDRQPVRAAIVSRLVYTLSLTGLSLALAYFIAVPLGVFSAARPGSRFDAVTTVLVFVLFSVPAFFSGTLLLRLFAEELRWFPPSGFQSVGLADRTTAEQFADVLWHLFLPVVTYAAGILAVLSRYTRTGVIDVIRSDYVRTARAKGLPELVVLVKHAARNGMIPVLTLLGSLLPLLVSGSVVIEVVFNIPGMGLYLFDSINLRDYNAVMGVLVVVSFLTLVGVFLSDLLYAASDPRISLG
ncbi:MAG: ABC transporter permease [Myxococcota bacterium]